MISITLKQAAGPRLSAKTDTIHSLLMIPGLLRSIRLHAQKDNEKTLIDACLMNWHAPSIYVCTLKLIHSILWITWPTFLSLALIMGNLIRRRPAGSICCGKFTLQVYCFADINLIMTAVRHMKSSPHRAAVKSNEVWRRHGPDEAFRE